MDDPTGLTDASNAESRPDRRRIPRWCVAAASIAVSLALLVTLALTVDMTTVVEVLAGARLSAMVVPVLAIAMSFVFATFRFRIIVIRLTGGCPRILPLIRLNFLTSLLVHVLPVSAMADAARIGYIRSHVRVSMLRATETVFVDRALGLLMLVCLALALLPFQRIVFGAGPVLAAESGLLVALAVAAAGGFWTVHRLAGGSLLGEKRWLLGIHAIVRRFGSLLSGWAAWGAQVGLAAAGGIVVALAVWSLGHAMDLDIPISTALLITPVLMISQSIPITYAGWGSRDATVIALSGWALPLSQAEAFALSIAMGVVIFLASLPGFVFFLADFRDLARSASDNGGTK